MNQKRLLPFVIVALCVTALLAADSSAQKKQRHGRGAPRRPAPTSTLAATSPPAWPNLDVLAPFHGLHGESCDLNGAGKVGTEKAKSNRLKNRYTLPDAAFEEVTFAHLLALNQGEISSDKKQIINFPRSNDPNNQRAVSIVGYVISAKASGCAVRKDKQGHVTSQGESCNCNTADPKLCDAHIEIVSDPDADHAGGRGVVVVEVTERARRLAALRLLEDHNTIGTNWSSWTLGNKKSKNRIVGKWVRFSGWLFYDADHFDQAWAIDPQDKIGGSNFRETAWEMHPVMGIEVLPGPPSGR